MENHAEHPAREPKVPKEDVILPQRVRGRDPFTDLRHAPVVREVVEQREDDGEGLLHAHEAVEGPFAVELVYWLHVRRVALQPPVRYDVLACIIALGRAVPQQDAPVES